MCIDFLGYASSIQKCVTTGELGGWDENIWEWFEVCVVMECEEKVAKTLITN